MDVSFTTTAGDRTDLRTAERVFAHPLANYDVGVVHSVGTARFTNDRKTVGFTVTIKRVLVYSLLRSTKRKVLVVSLST